MTSLIPLSASHFPPAEIIPPWFPLDLVQDSPFQHRTDYVEADMLELEGKMRRHGQLSAILVRPVSGRLELMAGHRRLRAAKRLGWAAIRCEVMGLDDGEAMEMVLIEQMSHAQWKPSEMATGVHALYERRDAQGGRIHTLETLALKLNKPESFVRGLLDLHEMPAAVSAAVDSRRLAMRVVEMIASVRDEHDQTLFARMCLEPAGKKEPLTRIEAQELLADRFARSLTRCGFDQEDASLVPVETVDGKPAWGGACAACMARSGNHAAYQADQAEVAKGGAGTGAKGNLCLYPPCFKRKVKASREAMLADAVSRGLKVMDASEAKKIFDADGDGVLESSGWVDIESRPDPALAGHFDMSKMPTWAKLLKAKAPGQVQVWLAVRHDGAQYEVVSHEAALRAVFPDQAPAPKAKAAEQSAPAAAKVPDGMENGKTHSGAPAVVVIEMLDGSTMEVETTKDTNVSGTPAELREALPLSWETELEPQMQKLWDKLWDLLEACEPSHRSILIALWEDVLPRVVMLDAKAAPAPVAEETVYQAPPEPVEETGDEPASMQPFVEQITARDTALKAYLATGSIAKAAAAAGVTVNTLKTWHQRGGWKALRATQQGIAG